MVANEVVELGVVDILVDDDCELAGCCVEVVDDEVGEGVTVELEGVEVVVELVVLVELGDWLVVDCEVGKMVVESVVGVGDEVSGEVVVVVVVVEGVEDGVGEVLVVVDKVVLVEAGWVL